MSDPCVRAPGWRRVRPVGTLLVLVAGVLAGVLASFGCATAPRRLHPQAISYQAAGARSLARAEIDRAAGQFSLALEYEPKMVEAINGLGLVALARGDRELAESHFRKALALNEEFAEAH